MLRNFLVLVLIFMTSDCAKILGIFGIPSQSHHILGESLLKGLAAKGHDVTMCSSFRSKNPPKNYKDLYLTGLLEIKEELLSDVVKTQQNSSYVNKMLTNMHYFGVMEEFFYKHKVIQDLIKAKMQYDLVLLMWFGNNAILALGHHVAKHTIIFSTIGSHAMITKLTKAPAPPSYVPNLIPPLPHEMSFIDRLQNTFSSVMFSIFIYFLGLKQKSFIDKYFLDSPTIDELYEHTSLVLLNTHYSIESPRPYVPQMVQVGGLHLEEPKDLTGELKTFMDEAKKGVILFSMGSNIESSNLDSEKLQEIVKCFSKLPYNVLWKFEKNNFLNLPKNVKISNWLPQRDLLAHKNMKLFITHGGLLSTTEAIYHGVPMVGIPIFGDQDGNVNDGVTKGYLVQVAYADLSDETFCGAINEVIDNPKYRDNIQLRSRVFRDQPIKPLEKAVYWVEYVLRHDGAHHLKTSAFKLNCLQQYLIDVIAFVLGVTLAVIYILRKILKYVCNCLCKISSKRTRKSKKKSKTA